MCPLAHAHVQTVFGAVYPLQLLKVLPGVADVDEGGRRSYGVEEREERKTREERKERSTNRVKDFYIM